MARHFMDEACDALGIAHGSILFDVKEFYDTLCIGLLMHRCLDLKYSATVLLLSAQIYLGPRILRDRSSCSEPIIPTLGITAGCRNAKNGAAAFLYPILDTVHRAYFPRGLVAKSWVDDVNFRTEGPRKQIVQNLTDAAVNFADMISRDGLRLSEKSAVLASDRALAAEITCSLRAAGLQVKNQGAAADLGIERGPNRLYRAERHRGRKRLAKWQASRLARLAGSATGARAARRVVTTGLIPRIAYRTRVIPLAPNPLTRLRRALGKFTVSRARGRCLSTALHLDYGDQDPAISLPSATVALWFELMSSSALMRRRAARAWPRVLKGIREAKPHHRWRKMRGQIRGVRGRL